MSFGLNSETDPPLRIVKEMIQILASFCGFSNMAEMSEEDLWLLYGIFYNFSLKEHDLPGFSAIAFASDSFCSSLMLVFYIFRTLLASECLRKLSTHLCWALLCVHLTERLCCRFRE